jgi:cytochrome P450
MGPAYAAGPRQAKRRLVSSDSLRPPVPAPPAHTLSLWGFLRAVRTNALTIWPEAAYHEDVSVRDFLGRSNITLNAPEAIHHILLANAANYRRSPASIRILRPITGEGLLLSEGEAWKHQRQTIAPSLAPRVMPMLARHIVEAARRKVADFENRLETPIRLLPEMQLLALETAGRSMFSMQMDEFGPAMRGLLTEFAGRHAKAGMLDMLLPPAIPTLADLSRRRFSRRWMGLIETILADRMGKPAPEAPADLLDSLRATRDPETGVAFSPTQLRDQVATLLLAGHETTALVLFWALFLLAQAEEEQDALAEEVRDIPLQPETAALALPALVRTRAVINETLRLFPPAFTLVREAIGPDEIGGMKIPRRAVVMIAPWVLHRHHKRWPDPDAFLPSRFLPGAPAPPRYAFMPFGAGPRVCIGAQFAMAEATLVLASLMRAFHVERADNAPVMPTALVTTQPDRAAYFRFARRRN